MGSRLSTGFAVILGKNIMVRQLLCMLTASITLGISVVFKVEIQSQIFLKRRKGKKYNHYIGSLFGRTSIMILLSARDTSLFRLLM
jgi:hypothetical protein